MKTLQDIHREFDKEFFGALFNQKWDKIPAYNCRKEVKAFITKAVIEALEEMIPEEGEGTPEWNCAWDDCRSEVIKRKEQILKGKKDE